MKTIDELQAELRLICSELEKLKESQKAETREVNFREIAARAERYPILGHPMVNEDEHTKDMYILMLLSVAALDDEKNEESFMTIYRIAFGMNFSGNIESLFLSAKSMKFETLDECTRLFINTNLRLVLMLECMMIAAGFENGKRKAMEYIAQLAVMLNVSKDEIEFLANLARVVLTQDLNEYRIDKLNDYGNIFDFYLDTFEDKLGIQIIEALLHIRGRDGALERDLSLKSIHIKDHKIMLNYKDDFPSFLKITSNKEINTSNMLINYIRYLSEEDIRKILNERVEEYLFAKGDDYKKIYYTQKLAFGVMSNHPLAHSKAIAQYMAAGGVIDKQEK